MLRGRRIVNSVGLAFSLLPVVGGRLLFLWLLVLLCAALAFAALAFALLPSYWCDAELLTAPGAIESCTGANSMPPVPVAVDN